MWGVYFILFSKIGHSLEAHRTSEEVDTGTIYTQVIPHPRPEPIPVKKWTQAQSTPKSSPIRDQTQY